MPYEIYVPKKGKKETWLRLLVEAESWSAALKSGLAKLGEDGAAVESATLDVLKDGSLLIRDTVNQRTILMRELPQPGTEPRASTPPVQEPRPGTRDTPPPTASKLGGAPQGKVVDEREATPPPAVTMERPAPAARGDGDGLVERIRAEAEALCESAKDPQSIAGQMLDLAMKHIPCESGSVLYTHINRRDLYFAAARGPKASEILAFKVPIGRGIVGFAAAEGTCLAVTDVSKDPRFFKKISEAIGHQVETIMAAPILSRGRSFGAIELINREGRHAFTAPELEALSYVGYCLAETLHRLLTPSV